MIQALRKSSMKILFKEARPADRDALIGLMREYYAHDGIRLLVTAAKARLKEFLMNPGLGKAWFIADAEGEIMGYVVVTKGYGLEHGPNVTIDELYFRERYRGAGCGGKALRLLEDIASSWGVESIHTEVERDNAGAVRVWAKNGFHAHARYPMVEMLKYSHPVVRRRASRPNRGHHESDYQEGL